MTKKAIFRKLNNITHQIVAKFSPEKIILFGSYAWGTPGTDSDIDLFIVKKTKRSTRDVAREIDESLWGSFLPIDIIVYTPENAKKRLRMKDFFINDIFSKGKILYSAN